jgi:hypothetical protein
MTWDAVVGMYIGGAIVAAWVQFMATSEETETMLDLSIIFGWPIMMAISIAYTVWDQYQEIKKGTPHD